jgi:hypothetical protein
MVFPRKDIGRQPHARCSLINLSFCLFLLPLTVMFHPSSTSEYPLVLLYFYRFQYLPRSRCCYGHLLMVIIVITALFSS